MDEIPFFHRLQTRLTLLILVVVAVLAGATAVQLSRSITQARVGVVDVPRPSATEPALNPGPVSATREEPVALSAILRSSLINLVAVFLFTLVGATVFSRSLLTEPIAALLRGTQELAAGKLGVTLPVTSRSELGVLAETFNRMSVGLAQRARELLEANEALRVSEERYQLAIRGANDGIFDWDPAADTLYLAPRFHGMLGYPEGSIPPTVAGWLGLAHPDDRDALEHALRAHASGDAPTFELEHRLRHADGGWRWMLARGAALRGPDGRAQRVAGSISDITERAEARTQLENRVTERTADLEALLELSNSTALSLELLPMLEQILARLAFAVRSPGATVFEPGLDDDFRRLAGRGEEPPAAVEAMAHALRTRAPKAVEAAAMPTVALPVVVRDAATGVLLLTTLEPLADERLGVVSAFATQLGVAMENAHLSQKAQDQAAFEERQHLARELHDSVSQALYGILLGTHTAQRTLDGSVEAARDALAYVENLAQAGLKEMRALIFVLRPESLEQEGLIGVLRKQLDAMETRHGIDVSLAATEEPELPFASKQVLYRVAQEALHNVVKHARASRVRVALRRGEQRVTLVIEDDGAGFDAAADHPGHLGLTSMRERVASLGGSLDLWSREGEGTRLTVEAPCPASAVAADAGSVPPSAREHGDV